MRNSSFIPCIPSTSRKAFKVIFFSLSLLAPASVLAVDDATAAAAEDATVVTCSDFQFGCHACTDSGCYYCPLTGLCHDSPDVHRGLFAPGYSCQVPQDYISLLSPASDMTCDDIPSVKDFFFSDPLISVQRWALDMIDVESVWRDKGYFGTGVHVRVNDGGVSNPVHAEFGHGGSRIDWSSSCDDISSEEQVFGSEADSSGLGDAPTTRYSHGLSVASVIGAEGGNGECAVGVAPRVTFSFCTASGGVENFLSQRMDNVDISHNSWAQPACERASRRRYRTRRTNIRDKVQLGGWRDDKDEEVSQCPFSYRPQGLENAYNLTFPCDVCEDFLVALNGDQDLIVNKNINEECSKAIKDHCFVYYDQDNAACIDYLDMILQGGQCKFGDMMSDELREVLEEGIQHGRQGKGVIYIFASGNANMNGDDAGLQPHAQNTRYTITVGAVGFDGTKAWYSTPSAIVLVSAPSGDYRLRETQMVGAALQGTCGDAGSGTSFAAPVISGVVALMLEANPDLTWRDVQAILVSTSRPPEQLALPKSTLSASSPYVDDTEAVNGAGYWHSHYYGFGIVNAANAVEAAETWVNLGPEKMILAESGELSLIISDDASKLLVTNLVVPATDDITGSNNTNLVVETVYLYISIDHSSRGHLRITLTSPQGMDSVVSPGNRPENGQAEVWQFTTVRSWGESPVGNWTLSITDTRKGDVVECFEDEWAYDDSEVGVLTCKSLEVLQYCEGGMVDPYGFAAENVHRNPSYDSVFGHVSNGRLASEACCACGGGVDSDEWPEALLSWHIEVYAHDLTSSAAPTLSSSPTASPTQPTSSDATEPPSFFLTDDPGCKSIGKKSKRFIALRTSTMS